MIPTDAPTPRASRCKRESPATTSLLGAHVSDRYELESLRGVGGQAWVFAARDLASGERVALKLLRPELHKDVSALRRFRRESLVLLGISHPNVVRARARGVDVTLGPWLALDLLEGEALDARIAAGATFSAREAAGMMASVLDALAAAQAVGVTHRDLKPSNVFLAERDGREVATVIDFGVSHRESSQRMGPRITQEGELVGTPAYMAPESLFDCVQDMRRLDVWSAGVMLYEMVTGRRLLSSGPMATAFERLAVEGDAVFVPLRAKADSDFVQIVRECLAREPEQRPDGAGALRDRLRAWLADR
jgi:serine/threonine protein kinase